MEKQLSINVDERVERAVNYFKAGYNCAQAVVMAFDDVMEMSTEVLARLTAPFGGGMGRMREVCGTVSGMAFVAGAIAPSTDPSNLEERKQNYALVQQFADAFRAVVCLALSLWWSVLRPLCPRSVLLSITRSVLVWSMLRVLHASLLSI